MGAVLMEARGVGSSGPGVPGCCKLLAVRAEN